jgi:hypothetical protein
MRIVSFLVDHYDDILSVPADLTAAVHGELNAHTKTQVRRNDRQVNLLVLLAQLYHTVSCFTLTFDTASFYKNNCGICGDATQQYTNLWIQILSCDTLRFCR